MAMVQFREPVGFCSKVKVESLHDDMDARFHTKCTSGPRRPLSAGVVFTWFLGIYGNSSPVDPKRNSESEGSLVATRYGGLAWKGKVLASPVAIHLFRKKGCVVSAVAICICFCIRKEVYSERDRLRNCACVPNTTYKKCGLT